jgi:hypothetical protein
MFDALLQSPSSAPASAEADGRRRGRSMPIALPTEDLQNGASGALHRGGSASISRRVGA